MITFPSAPSIFPAVIRGNIKSVSNNREAQESIIGVSATRIHRQKFALFQPVGKSGKSTGSIHTLLRCGVKPGPGSFLFTGWMHFAEAWLTCAPRYKDFIRIYEEARQAHENPCEVSLDWLEARRAQEEGRPLGLWSSQNQSSSSWPWEETQSRTSSFLPLGDQMVLPSLHNSFPGSLANELSWPSLRGTSWDVLWVKLENITKQTKAFRTFQTWGWGETWGSGVLSFPPPMKANLIIPEFAGSHTSSTSLWMSADTSPSQQEGPWVSGLKGWSIQLFIHDQSRKPGRWSSFLFGGCVADQHYVLSTKGTILN